MRNLRISYKLNVWLVLLEKFSCYCCLNFFKTWFFNFRAMPPKIKIDQITLNLPFFVVVSFADRFFSNKDEAFLCAPSSVHLHPRSLITPRDEYCVSPQVFREHLIPPFSLWESNQIWVNPKGNTLTPLVLSHPEGMD